MASQEASLNCFSESYPEARAKFLEAASRAGAKLHELEVAKDAAERYTMDVAVVHGSGSGLIVVSSGTHGVEGYAGSAIQVQVLKELLENPVAKTVVLVHAVNPYGMAHFRRFNENNVDLNRNALLPEQLQTLASKDSLHSTYMRFDGVFNPIRVPGSFYVHVGIWLHMGYNVLRYGLKALKTALVAATYSQSKGIFHGGKELQRSHVTLRDFMTSNFNEVPASEVVWVDVHTGLGPCGVDVLLGDSADEAEMKAMFPKIAGDTDGFQAGFSKPADAVIKARCEGSAQIESAGPVTQSAGYELTVGILGTEWVSRFFKPCSGRPLVITQEFGTRSNLFVARALMLENVGYHYDRANHEYWRSFTRDAFYVRTPSWKRRVLSRGEQVFRALAGLER